MTTAPNKKRPSVTSGLTLEALEPRVLFSADVLPVLVNDSSNGDAQVNNLDPGLSGLQALPAPDRLELVFIDRSTPDYQSLIADLQTNTESGTRYQVEFIERDENGIGKISGVLSKLDTVAAVHVISHGSNGVVQLGALSLDASNILDHADQIAAWRSALTVDADLLFYGCELAYDAGGEFLLSQIADLSGADVAASQDATGTTTLGGDWEFESEIGVIETQLPFTSAVVDSYTGLLSITDVTGVNSGVEMNTLGGNNGYLFASVPLDASAITDELTVEVRFSSDDNLTASPLISHVSSGQEFELSILADGTLRIGVNGQVMQSSAMNYLSLADGDIHSIALSWSATNGGWSVYVDGLLTESATGLATGYAINLTGTTVLGQTQTSTLAGFNSSEIFSGVLHDVRIFSEVRSSSEIALNHSHKFDIATKPDALIANWQMDGLAAHGVVRELIDATGQTDLTPGSVSGASFVPGQVVEDLRIQENSVIGSVVGHVSPVMESSVVDLVTDGSFQDHGFAPMTHTEVFAGQTFGGWTVTSGGVEVDTGRDLEASPLGGSAVDLNGTVAATPGIIEQQLTTVAGQKYQLVFAMSGTGTGGETIKNLRVNIAGGSTFFDYEVDPAWSATNVMWQHRSMEFTATGPTTTLQIESLEPNFWGPLIGDVRVVAIPDYTDDVLATDPDLFYDAITDKFYKPVVTTTESWLDAQANSMLALLNGKPGQLMTIRSAYENDIGHEFAESLAESIWIGASDSDNEGEWFWDKGNEPDDQFWQGNTSGAMVGNSYQNWATNDPNLNEDYGIMNTAGKWHDGPGNVAAYSYLIEWRGEDIVTPYTYSLTNDAGGLFTIDPLNGEISVAGSGIDYEQAAVQNVSVKITNAVGAEYIHSVPIEVLDVNDSPVLEYNINTKVTDLGAVPITRSQLTTADADHPTSNIVYTITTAALHGRIALDTAPWSPISSFTQQDIDDEKLVYVHTGGGSVDSFDFTVTDGEFSVNDTFNLTIEQPEALELSSGVELNLDDGNDVYLQSAPLGGPVLDATTVELIFAAQNTPDSTPLFAIDDGAAPSITLGINNITGGLEFSVGGSAIQVSLAKNYSNLLLDGTPHSLALSWSTDGEWTIYVDGRRADGGGGLSVGSSLDFSSSRVVLGEPYNASSYFSGNLYDVRVWDNSRSAEDIGYLYDRKIEIDPGLVFYSQMEGLNQLPPTPQNPVIDLVGGIPLSVLHASGPQFTASEAITDLNVDENSPTGTSVGFLIPHESELTRFVQTDGDFTDAGTPATSQTFSAGQTFGGWQVAGGSIDQLRADGVVTDQTLLGGNAVRFTDANASVSQTLATEAGRLYQLNYSVAGDFSTASSPVDINATAGNLTELVSVANDTSWDLANNLMWQHRSMLFAADSATTQLAFEALTANAMIADVMVVEISHEVAGVLASQRDMTYDAITQKFYKTLGNKTTISGANNTSVNQTVYGVSSRLVTIHSAYENARVHSLIKDFDKGAWLGADDAANEGDWKWNLGGGDTQSFWSGNQNGGPVNGAYSNWKPNLEPNNYQHASPVEGEHYAVMDLTGQWNDEPFTTGLNYAIFEWDVNDVADAFQFGVASGSSFDVDANTGEVTVAAGAVLDHETTPAISTTFTIDDLDNQTGIHTASIIVNDVNEAPIGSDFTVSANEDGTAFFNSSLFSVTDVEQHGLHSITIDSLPQGGDLKLYNTLVAVGQVILKADITALTYTPLPDVSGLNYDNFTYTIRDDGGVKRGGQDTSAGSNTVFLDVIAVNDEPAGKDNTFTIDENTPLVFNVADFGFSDPKDNHGFDSVQIAAISGPATVFLGATPLSAGQWVLAADIIAGLLYVQPDPHVNGTSLITLDFRVRDDGGQNNGGIDADQSANTITINVTPVNHAPDGTDKTILVQENTVTALAQSDFGFNDGLEGDLLATVRIDTLPSQGTLLFDGTPILAGHIITPSVLNNNRIEYASGNFQSGAAISFDFTVRDNGGTANGGSDTDPQSNTITIAVADVNIAPAGKDNTVQFAEDSFHQFVITDFGFTDADAHGFSAVKIAVLPQQGSLELSGNAVAAGQIINSSDLVNLRYYAAPNANGAAYASIDFNVIDSGGVANGGVDTDQTANTITFDVLSVNDAPAGADRTINLNEDTAYQFSPADFGFTDTDGNSFNTVEIVAIPANGTLQTPTGAVVAGDVIPAAAINSMTYTPPLNASGSAYDNLTFKVRDNGGTLNGGVDTDAVDKLITFNLLEVNDAPSGTDSTIAVNEYSTISLSAGDFGFSDVEPDNFATLTVNTLPATGALLLSGNPVSAGQTINAGALSNLLYQVGSNNGSSSANFDFTVQDTGGTANGGIDTDPTVNTITFTIANVNLAPSGTDKTVVINEDTQHTFSAADFGFTDTDLNGFASVEITTLPSAGALVFSGGNVTAGQSIVAGSLANLEYIPAANANGAGYASFSFKVRDDGGVVNGGSDTDPTDNSISIDVLSVNDAPAGTDSTITVNEYSVISFGPADFGFSDLEADNFATVKVTSLPVVGTLQLSGTAVAVGQTINAGQLSGLEYQLNSNGGLASTSFDFQVQDTGGTVNGGVDTDPTANTITLALANVNLAPAGSNKTVVINEDSQYAFSAADFGYSDADSNALAAVEITTLPSAGTLTLFGSSVSAGQSIAVADLSDLEYIPATNGNGTGYASFSFKVRDDGGAANGGSDTDPTANTITIDVLSVNDAPSAMDLTVVVAEYSVYSFAAADFGYSDIEADNFATLTITSLPTVGTLQLNSSAVVAGQTINAGQLSGLEYHLNSNAGLANTSFDFQVQDVGGTANGGVDTDPTANTITIVLANVNLAPAGTDKSVAINEDTQYTFSAADFGYSDIDLNALAAIEITTLPSAGALTLSGSNVTAGQNVLASDIANLVFAPAANANGAGYASFGFKVRDDGGVANGGSDTDPTANNITIDVVSVNDAPSGANNTIAVDEYSVYNFAAADFGFTDPDADNFATVKITSLPAVGSLQVNGSAITAGLVINAGQISAIQYQLNSSNGAANTSFDFQVQDTGGTLNGGLDTDPIADTITFTLIDRNLPPEGTDKTIVLNEDTVHTFSVADFGFSDPDQNNFISIEVTNIPVNGTLLLNGSAVVAGQVVPASEFTDLQFTPALNANGNNYDSLSFKVRDDGGAANNGSDVDAIANTITFHVQSINDEPTGTDNTIQTNENTAYAFSAADFGFSDPDQHNFVGVLIDANPNNGTLSYASGALTPGQVIPVNNIGSLIYTPVQGVSGAASDAFTFVVTDDGGVANGGSDTDATPNTITIDVLDFNRPPSGTDAAVQLNEDISYQFSAADFGFTDPDADGFATLTLVSLPQNGQLTLSGNTVALNQVINAGDLVNLVFTPDANQSGANYASFGFVVRDNGGTANGGSDTDTTSNSIVVSVLPVNDSPAGISSSVLLSEDTFYTFALSDFGFTDAEQNSLSAIQIVSLPANGSLTLAGNAVTAGQTVPAGLITDLRFDPLANANGIAYDSFGFKVVDDGGVSNGGVDTDTGVAQINIDILSVNDEPSGADSAITLSETSGYVFSASDFGFTDTDANSLDAVIIQSLPATGVLTLAGSVVTQNQVIDAADLVNLEFQAPNGGGSTTTIDFQVRDTGGTTNGGVNTDQSANTFTIQILNQNIAPTGTDNVLTIAEDSFYQFSVADFGFNDIDQNNFSSVEIVTTPASGLLMLSGNAVSNGQSIQVQNISNLTYTPMPDASGQNYTALTFKVKDDGGTANNGVDTDQIANSIAIDVLSINDAPQGNDSVLTISEDSSYQFSAADFGFSDVDQNKLSAVEIVTAPASGTLNLNGAVVTDGQSVLLQDLPNLAFTPTPDASGVSYATLTFTVVDDGGVANGGIDTDPVANSIVFDVLSVNDAPVGSDNTITIAEDGSYQFGVADFGFTDVDLNNFQSVEIMNLPVSGTLTLAGNAVVDGQTIAVQDFPDLTFIPEADASGQSYASFTFKVKDNGGSVNGGSDTDAVANTININILSVNDAPAGSDNTIVIAEDNSYLFSAADFGFTDPEQNGFATVTFNTIPAQGVFALDGVAVVAGQSVAAGRISDLSFTPATNASNSNYAQIGFTVQDNGGTMNGGVDTDPVENTIFIDVYPVNDAPQGIDKTITVNEDGSHAFSTSDFGFTDAEGDVLSEVVITAAPVNGQLSLSGVPVVAMQSIPASEIQNLLFEPAADAVGSPYTQLQFQIRDAGGSANGGSDTDTVPDTLNIVVEPINDPPIGRNQLLTVTEDTDYIFDLTDFNYTDIENDALLAVEIAALPSAGDLTLFGTPVAGGDLVLAADIDAGSLVFTPQGNINGQTTMEFHVIDAGGVAFGGNDTDPLARELLLNIVAVNDSPQGSDASVSLAEDNDYVFSISDFGYSDPIDNDPMASVSIDSLPAHGVLHLAGNPVLSGQVLNVADLSAGLLIYTPSANVHSNSGFDFRVIDAAGGIDKTANSYEFNLSSVNDAPSGSDTVVSVSEGAVHVFAVSEFGFTDSADNDGFAGIIVSELPYSGQITVNGQIVSVGEFINVNEILSGALAYQAADEPSIIGNQFGFTVKDDGGTAPGFDIDLSENFISFNVQSVNDAPQLSTSDVVLDEGSSIAVTAAELFATDADDRSDNLYFTVVETPVNGFLTRNSEVLQINDSFTLQDIINDDVQYHHDGSETSVDSVLISVADGGEDGAQPVQGILQFNITEVLDPPPETVNDNITASKSGATLIDVLDNDQSGLEDDSEFVISIEVPPSFGEIILNDDGTFVYTPDISGEVFDSFSYRVTNSDGAFSIATVNISLDDPAIAQALAEPFPDLFDLTSVQGVTSASDNDEESQEADEIEVEQVEEASEGEAQMIDEELLLDRQSVASSTTKAVASNTSIEVSQVDELQLLSTERLRFTDGLEEIEIRKHNNLTTGELKIENVQTGLSSFQIVFDVPVPELRDVVENRTFQRALGQVGEQLADADSEQQSRIALGEDAALGVSISVSAGALAWMLRGGSLLASMVAATPIWSNMDPLRILTSDRRETDDSEGEVEQIFE